MRRAARVDSNQEIIVRGLRSAGATVAHLHTVGGGVPDILVGYRGVNYLLEVKQSNGKLNDDQVDWHTAWRGRVVVVRTVDEALTAIGAIR